MRALLFLFATLPTAFSSVIHDVRVDNSFFPNKLEIAVGDTVRFRFLRGTHTVTHESATACQPAQPSEFDFRLKAGLTTEKVFTKPGVYNYFSAYRTDCRRGMRGSITVGTSAPNDAPANAPANGTAPGNATTTPATPGAPPAAAAPANGAPITGAPAAPVPTQDIRPSSDQSRGPAPTNTTLTTAKNDAPHAGPLTMLIVSSVAVVAFNV